MSPWGEGPAWMQAGIVASTICNANPFRKRGAKGVTPTDLMPRFQPPGWPSTAPPKPPHWREQQAAFAQYVRLHNAGLQRKATRRNRRRV